MAIDSSNRPFSTGLKIMIAKTGLKQSYVARKAGYTDRELSDMLNGRRLIRACDIPRIAFALNVTADDIYNAAGSVTAGSETRK